MENLSKIKVKENTSDFTDHTENSYHANDDNRANNADLGARFNPKSPKKKPTFYKVHTLKIKNKGEKKLFQIKLPQNAKRILGINVTVQLLEN